MGVERLQERPYLTTGQASRTLGIHQSTVHTLVEQGLLTETPRPRRIDSRSMPALIEKASVETLRQVWNPMLPLEHVATSLLGIPTGTMAGLARNGVFIPARGPDVDGYPATLYQPEDVERLTREVLSRTVAAQALIPEAISVAQLYRFQPPWQSLAQTVLAILKGRLTPLDLKSQAPLFQRLVIPKQSGSSPGSASGYESGPRFHHEGEIQSTQS
jgi:predicted DNA-binding transcriptional regulator AlpA